VLIVNGDGFTELVLSAGPGAKPEVKTLDAHTFNVIDDFFAFDSTFGGGVTLGK
jgi:hypothetical protein